MTQKLHRFAIAMLLPLISVTSYAQVVTGNAFLQSNYIEMGINPNGVYISNIAPPVGYVPAVNVVRGIIADSDKDGWGTGTPAYCGDYFAPGTPEEGFAIQANGINYYNSYSGTPAAPGSIVNYSNTVTSVNAVWKGNISAIGLQITQQTSVPHGGLTRAYNNTIENTSASVINGVFYSRNADPDNEQEVTGDFTTENIIVENHPADDWAIVSATGLTYCYFAMASMMSNARASYGTFFTTDLLPQNVWAGIAPWSITGSVTDIATQMTFKIGKINPGQTKVISFIYGTNEADLTDYVGFTGDDVVGKMEAALNGGINYDVVPEFSINPNPTSGRINLYGYNISNTATIDLQIVNIMGQIVDQHQLENSNGITSLSFDLDNGLQNGTYFANFIVDGKVYAQPFVLNR